MLKYNHYQLKIKISFNWNKTYLFQEVLKPLQKLSLQIQKPESNVADSIHWVEATVELTQECKMIMRYYVYFYHNQMTKNSRVYFFNRI